MKEVVGPVEDPLGDLSNKKDNAEEKKCMDCKKLPQRKAAPIVTCEEIQRIALSRGLSVGDYETGRSRYTSRDIDHDEIDG